MALKEHKPRCSFNKKKKKVYLLSGSMKLEVKVNFGIWANAECTWERGAAVTVNQILQLCLSSYSFEALSNKMKKKKKGDEIMRIILVLSFPTYIILFSFFFFGFFFRPW